jgi:hypothetical protein
MNPVELYGNLEENFYQLGLTDRESGKIVHKSVKGMLKTPYAPVNKLMEEVGKQVIKNTLLKNPKKYLHLNSYAEGMNLPIEEVFYTMLIPELVSAMTKWAPGIVAGNLGCSSFFMLNKDQQMVHGRILDFPLQGSYDVYERIMSFHLDGMPVTIGFNASGIPYPSITAMTEDGMTIALHQKFTNIFNKDGESIFEIIFELIQKARDKKSVLEFLKTKKSLTTWCLYISFKNGEILAYDLMGNDSFYNEIQIKENEVLYFCNHLENKTINQKDFLPLGFHDYNCMRESTANLKIKQFIKQNKFSDFDLLKMMMTPHFDESKHPNIYQMDNITPSTLTALTMNPSAGHIHYITGSAPKIYRQNMIEFKNCFKELNLEVIHDKKSKAKLHNEYWRGLHAIMEAQKGFDNKDPSVIYHQLQMAKDHLEAFSDKAIVDFYFLVAQYIYESHTKVLFQLLSDFKNLAPLLPSYLHEQCLLFQSRLEYILKLPITLESDKIKTSKLKELYNLEMKIPRALFHLTQRTMIVPRIDILDVIYVYTI